MSAPTPPEFGPPAVNDKPLRWPDIHSTRPSADPDHSGTDPAGRRRVVDVAGRVVIGLAAPLLIYYLLRAAGAGVYLALLVSTLVSAVPSLLQLLRRERLSALSAYLMTMMLGSVVVATIAGSTEFLLAKEAVLTGVTGLWFLASALTNRPLSYVFTRPLLQGRLHWPDHWDELWARSPRWRSMWRCSSLMWGCGTLADAVLRVVLAYTIPPDAVPALATGLIAATMAVLIVTTNALYVACGVFNPRSAVYRGGPAATPRHRPYLAKRLRVGAPSRSGRRALP